MALGLGLGLGLTKGPFPSVEQVLVNKYDAGSSGYFNAESEFMTFSSGTDIQTWSPVYGSSSYENLIAIDQCGLISDIDGTGFKGIAEGSNAKAFLESAAVDVTGRTSCLFAFMWYLPPAIFSNVVPFSIAGSSGRRIIINTGEDIVWDDEEDASAQVSLLPAIPFQAGWNIVVLNNTTQDNTNVYYNAKTLHETFSMDDVITTGGNLRTLTSQAQGFAQGGQDIYLRKYMELDASATNAEVGSLIQSWADEVGLFVPETIEEELVTRYDGGSSGFFNAEPKNMTFSSGTDVQVWNPTYGSSSFQNLIVADQAGLVDVGATGFKGLGEGSSGNLFLESAVVNETGRSSCLYAFLINVPTQVTPQQVIFSVDADSSTRILLRTNEDAVWDDSEGGDVMTSLLQSVPWTAGWQIIILNNTTVDTTDVYHNALTKLKTFSMDDVVTTGGTSRQLLHQATGFGQSGQSIFTRKFMELDESTTEVELQALMQSWADEVGLTLGA